jgi:hypothetical protein
MAASFSGGRTTDHGQATGKLYHLQLRVECTLIQGRIQDFKLRGGAYLKKLRRAEGGAKMFGVFRVKIRDFTPKKQITESPSYP